MTDVFTTAELAAAALGSFAIAYLSAKACLDGLLRVMSSRR